MVSQRGQRKTVRWMVLAHHNTDQVDRCVLLPVDGYAVAICARCLGLYPMMIATIAVQLIWKVEPCARLDWWIAIVGLGPAIIDWGVSRLDIWRGHNAIRIVSGGLAGMAVGRSVFLYWRDPRHEVFLVQVVIIAICVVAFEVTRRFQLPKTK